MARWTVRTGLALLLACVCAVPVAAVAPPAAGAPAAGAPEGTPAAAASRYATFAVGLSFRGGPGHPGVVLAGTWSWRGKRGFCIDFQRHRPGGNRSVILKGRVPGMDAAQSIRAKMIANAYSGTRSRSLAANAEFALWTLRGDRGFRIWYRWARARGLVSDTRHAGVQRILAWSLASGPYKMAVTATPVLPGQTGRGTVRVRDGRGKPASGRRITLIGAPHVAITTVNGRRAGVGVTTRTGVVRYTFRRLDSSAPAIVATLTAPSSRLAILTLPSGGSQRLLAGRYVEAATGRVTFVKQLGRPSMVTTCDSDCEGVARVTFSASNPSGSRPVRYTWRVGTRTVASLTIAGGHRRSVKARIADGSRVTSQYCYVRSFTGGCVSGTIRFTGVVEVICPPWVTMTFTGTCPCEEGMTMTFALTAPARSVRAFRSRVFRDGELVEELALVNGRAVQSKPVAMPARSRVQVQFTAFRARVDGRYIGTLRSVLLFDLTYNGGPG